MHRLTVMAVFVLTIVATVYLYNTIQKDFIPAEDTGRLIAYAEGGQDISFDAMQAYQHDVAKIAAADPNVETVMSRVGASGSRLTSNAGLIFMRLKPRRSGPSPTSTRSSRNCAASSTRCRASRSSCSTRRRSGSADACPTPNTSTRCRISTSTCLYAGPTSSAKSMARLPGFQDVTSDLQIASPTIVVKIDRDKAATLGITADADRNGAGRAPIGSRQVSTIYTSSDQYAVILEVAPRFQRRPGVVSQALHPHRPTAAWFRCRRWRA